jgi:hypothetical protein
MTNNPQMIPEDQIDLAEATLAHSLSLLFWQKRMLGVSAERDALIRRSANEAHFSPKDTERFVAHMNAATLDTEQGEWPQRRSGINEAVMERIMSEPWIAPR